jgi:hypothetical protein
MCSLWVLLAGSPTDMELSDAFVMRTAAPQSLLPVRD